jgi:hypothetical protein
MGDNFHQYKGHYQFDKKRKITDGPYAARLVPRQGASVRDMVPGSRKRKQSGGFLMEASGGMLVESAAKTLVKTLIALAARYGLYAIERRLKGPDSNTWLHRIMYWVPNSALAGMIVGGKGDESMAVIGLSALMYANNYLNNRRRNETVEDTKRLKMEQERVDAQEAKTQEDARNALMQKKTKPEENPKPPKKKAKRKLTKSKVVKNDATVQD